MSRKPYSAAMTKYLFWFVEFKAVAHLMNEGKSLSEIDTINKSENIFKAKTEYRGKTIFNALRNRIEALPNEYIELFKYTDIDTQKLIAAIAVMTAESLFYDFMIEVYKEKILSGDKTLSNGDFIVFFRNKQVEDEKVASWTSNTFDRLGRAYRNVLLQSNLIKLSKKKEWLINKPIINRQLFELMQKTKMLTFYVALTGEKK
jgi:DNA-binding ferritin-like protein (Dps family)